MSGQVETWVSKGLRNEEEKLALWENNKEKNVHKIT
jgi:hypothetical protein